MLVKESSSSAVLTLASATFTAACGVAHDRLSRSSKVLSEMILLLQQRLAAHDVEVGVLHLGLWPANSSARACSSARSKGRGSITNKQVALLDQPGRP